MFAKIFETEKYGQILLKFDANENGNPEIRAYIQPKDLGVCSLAASADNDDDETWDEFENVFLNEFNEEEAIELLQPLLVAAGLFKRGEE